MVRQLGAKDEKKIGWRRMGKILWKNATADGHSAFMRWSALLNEGNGKSGEWSAPAAVCFCGGQTRNGMGSVIGKALLTNCCPDLVERLPPAAPV